MEHQTARLLLRDFTLLDIDAVHPGQSDPRFSSPMAARLQDWRRRFAQLSRTADGVL